MKAQPFSPHADKLIGCVLHRALLAMLISVSIARAIRGTRGVFNDDCIENKSTVNVLFSVLFIQQRENKT